MLELVVVIIAISLLAGVLLNRLSYYQEAAEKARMEYTIVLLKSALRIRISNLMMQGRMQEIASLAEENPMDWLDAKPANYMEQPPSVPAGKYQSGTWSFDRKNRRLVYSINSGNYFLTEPGTKKQVTLQLKLIQHATILANDVKTKPLPVSVTLQLDQPYRWF